MTRIEFKKLLQKQIDGQLDTTDLPAFQTILQKENEEELESTVEQLWKEYQADGKRHSSFNTIRNQLCHVIYKEKRRIFYRNTIRYAAVILLPLLMMFSVYHFTRTNTIKEFTLYEYIIETASGERSRVILPDGTKVLISYNSRLSYPASFGKQTREIRLTGEAFFEVSPNRELPFIVQSDEAKIKVLGTMFNVYAYLDEPFFEVSLQTGSLEVTGNRFPETSILLKNNEKAKMNYKDGILMKKQTDLRMETAWMRGDLYFRSESLLQIFHKMERFYGVNIRYTGELPSETFTGGYRETDIVKVLSNLQEHYTFSYEKNGNKLYIKF
ncbi:MAG: FecR domain-containing protein [Tannerellaceae bacterium]|jgi:ferric-dicitrate binding protein FerR (iron transport regulator)|nr:FecR domain-containing protein [Tannerellaceae bacterium]